MLQSRRSQNIIPKDSLVSFTKFCSLKIILSKISTFLKEMQLVSKLPRYWSGEEKSHHRGPEFNNMKHQILYWGTSSVEDPTGQ
jgi:hypothetical protein